MRIRRLEPADAEPLEALAGSQLRGTRYEMRAQEIIASALNCASDEWQGLVALSSAELIEGALVYGPLAGADTVEKLHLLAGTRDALAALVVAHTTARASSVRMVVCELPGDPLFESAARALVGAGFRKEGTVEGVFTPSVALEVYVLRTRG